MGKKKEGHTFTGVRLPNGLRELIDGAAAAEGIDRSAVIVQLLSQHMAELRARARPTRELLAEGLRADLGAVNAEAVLAIAEFLQADVGTIDTARVAARLRAFREAGCTLTEEQIVREALAHRRALQALEGVRERKGGGRGEEA